jgi:hypothetical protein
VISAPTPAARVSLRRAVPGFRFTLPEAERRRSRAPSVCPFRASYSWNLKCIHALWPDCRAGCLFDAAKRFTFSRPFNKRQPARGGGFQRGGFAASRFQR